MTAPTTEATAGATVAAAYYQAQAATAARVTAATAALWASMDMANLDAAWQAIRDEILALIITGQIRNASLAPEYVAVILTAAGLTPDPIAELSTDSFAGRSASGLSLVPPLNSPPIRVKQSLLAGKTLAEAAADGLAQVTMLAATEVADAGRGATEAAIRLEPQIVGFERYVSLPACDRCIILAGRVYKKSEGFPRHPNCDCSHRPIADRKARDGTEQEPSELFQSLTREEQDRIFTKDGAEAIRRGADLSQVVNARQGMSTPGDPFTTVGRGRGRRKKPSRLSPQGIARMAGDDEQLYLQLLRANRYI